jgi:hypothetical protein
MDVIILILSGVAIFAAIAAAVWAYIEKGKGQER